MRKFEGISKQFEIVGINTSRKVVVSNILLLSVCVFSVRIMGFTIDNYLLNIRFSSPFLKLSLRAAIATKMTQENRQNFCLSVVKVL